MKLNAEILDRMYGCLYGQCIGDALGSRYEFESAEDASREVDVDMDNNFLPILGRIGKPVYTSKKGQVTDDSEMALSLLHAILAKSGFDLEEIAKNYIEWYHSKPIDMGGTTKNAFVLRGISQSAEDMINKSRIQNMPSMSNGSIMRQSVLGIYGSFIGKKELAEHTKQDTILTHPNPLSIDASQTFTYLIRGLIRGHLPLDLITKILSQPIHPRLHILLTYAQKAPEPVYVIDRETIRGYPEIFVNTDDAKFQGYLGITLQNAVYELLNGKDFHDSMVNTVRKGGDADTNGAVAGALLGAFYGMKNIPKKWIETIDNFNSSRIHTYPKLSTQNLTGLVDELANVMKKHNGKNKSKARKRFYEEPLTNCK